MNSFQKTLRSQVYVATLLLAFNYNVAYALSESDEKLHNFIASEAKFVSRVLNSLCLPTNYKAGYQTVHPITEQQVTIASTDYDNIYGYFCHEALKNWDFNEEADVKMFEEKLIEKGITMNRDAQQEREKLEYLTSSWAQETRTHLELKKAVQD